MTTNGECRAAAALLEYRHAHPEGHSQGEAGGVWGRDCLRTAEEIVSALRRQLKWTHFLSIIYLDDPLKRDFYAEMCRIENWNTQCPSCNSKDCRLISGREFEVKALEVI